MMKERAWSALPHEFPRLQDEDLYAILIDDAVRYGHPFQKRKQAAKILVDRGHQPTIDTLEVWVKDPTLGIKQFIGTYFTDGPTTPWEYPDPEPDATPEQIQEMAENLLGPGKS